MIYKFLPLFLLFFSVSQTNTNPSLDKFYASSIETPSLEMRIKSIYNNLNDNKLSLPNLESFSQALEGFYGFREAGSITKDILTIIDFGLPSTSKRLWIIDLTTNTVLFNSYVTHGINSGLQYATNFSNDDGTNKSSLGFFATAETYNGKNGLSLKLDGLEQGVNNNARNRGLVVHGAYYANPNILQTQNYLGRSQGCPAIPSKLTSKIINLIKNKSCLFIYHPSRDLKNLAGLVS
jgi:hypothetical protein